MSESMIRIGCLAAQLAVTTRTIRYYEQLGLIRPTTISPKGYRFYSPDAVAVIKKIRELQSIGFSLAEIKEVIRLFNKQDKKLEAKRKMLAFMRDHLAEVDAKMKALKRMRTDLIRQVRITNRKLKQLAGGNDS